MRSAHWPIITSEHALERSIERFDGVPIGDLLDTIEREVREAIREGRLACSKPRFLIEADRPRRRVSVTGEHVRVAWTRNERRAFVLRRVRDKRGPAWVVMTVLVADWERERWAA